MTAQPVGQAAHPPWGGISFEEAPDPAFVDIYVLFCSWWWVSSGVGPTCAGHYTNLLYKVSVRTCPTPAGKKAKTARFWCPRTVRRTLLRCSDRQKTSGFVRNFSSTPFIFGSRYIPSHREFHRKKKETAGRSAPMAIKNSDSATGVGRGRDAWEESCCG